ncbi:phosphatidylserine/phosphatidylglycerophosphate/cardiolipin synthase-like enzyme [Klebsiella sp. SORGH_AS 1173]|nr:phosphatidylserine/phosphatidylglycerophosphate/cardiolipin synthase-like enzyme [Klebsiella sp. SORGH_AS_1173]
MKCRWQEGNRITLLENGDQYYPALFAAIGRASRRVILESFIWFEDEGGLAAARGAAESRPPRYSGGGAA